METESTILQKLLRLDERRFGTSKQTQKRMIADAIEARLAEMFPLGIDIYAVQLHWLIRWQKLQVYVENKRSLPLPYCRFEVMSVSWN